MNNKLGRCSDEFGGFADELAELENDPPKNTEEIEELKDQIRILKEQRDKLISNQAKDKGQLL